MTTQSVHTNRHFKYGFTTNTKRHLFSLFLRLDRPLQSRLILHASPFLFLQSLQTSIVRIIRSFSNICAFILLKPTLYNLITVMIVWLPSFGCLACRTCIRIRFFRKIWSRIDVTTVYTNIANWISCRTFGTKSKKRNRSRHFDVRSWTALFAVFIPRFKAVSLPLSTHILWRVQLSA